jgi:hypothetical protein
MAELSLAINITRYTHKYLLYHCEDTSEVYFGPLACLTFKFYTLSGELLSMCVYVLEGISFCRRLHTNGGQERSFLYIPQDEEPRFPRLGNGPARVLAPQTQGNVGIMEMQISRDEIRGSALGQRERNPRQA